MKRVKKQYEITEGIVVDKAVRFGKPVIKGTRVPVEVVLGRMAGGMDIEKVMREYDITKRDVLNTIRYAANIVATEVIHTETK